MSREQVKRICVEMARIGVKDTDLGERPFLMESIAAAFEPRLWPLVEALQYYAEKRPAGAKARAALEALNRK